MKRLAWILSIILHPLILLPLIPFIVVYRQTQDIQLSLMWMVISAIFIGIVGLFVLYEVHKKIFSNFDVSIRTQRPLLFFATTLTAALYLFILYIGNAPTLLLMIFLAFILGLILLIILNNFLKVSIHTATISAFLTALSLMLKGGYFLILLCIPLMIWSRLLLKRHKLSEALVGAILGIVLSYATYVIVHIVLPTL